MSALRAVLLDFGGVIYHSPNLAKLQRWMRLLGVRDVSDLQILHQSPTESSLVHDIMTGRVSEQEAWDELARRWGLRPQVMRLLRRTGFTRRHIDRDLLAFFASLRPRFRTAILTNAGTDFRGTFHRIYHLDRYTDEVIISAEERLAKPYPEIFHLAAARVNTPPEEILFVDDMPENVEGARQVGMTAFVHQSGPQTIAGMKDLLQI